MAGGRTVSASGWAVAGVLGVVGASRLLWIPDQPVWIAANAAAPLVVLGAFPLAVIALIYRRWALGACGALLLLAAGLMSTSAWGPGPSAGSSVGLNSVSITTGNLMIGNREVAQAGRDLLASDSDVIVIQEVSIDVLETLDEAGLNAAYPYSASDPHPYFHGGVIYSRFPIRSYSVADVAGSPMLMADIATPIGTVTVVDVHMVAPLTFANAAQWRRQFAVLRQLADKAPHPMVLAGDFNSVTSHKPFQTLLHSGFADTFESSGVGWGATYPSGFPIVPAIFRLDHVLVPQGWEPLSIKDWYLTGSDHRALTVRLANVRPTG